MKDKTSRKQQFKVIALTSLFWLTVAGVFILVQYTSNDAYNRGVSKGIQEIRSLQQAK